jgi:prophage regulatory protein
MSTPLLRLPAVIAATQLSRSTIYAAIQAGRFPQPVRVGERAVRWRCEDIEAWMAALLPARKA